MWAVLIILSVLFAVDDSLTRGHHRAAATLQPPHTGELDSEAGRFACFGLAHLCTLEYSGTGPATACGHLATVPIKLTRSAIPLVPSAMWIPQYSISGQVSSTVAVPHSLDNVDVRKFTFLTTEFNTHLSLYVLFPGERTHLCCQVSFHGKPKP